MGSRTQDQKEEVNTTRCLICFRLRTAILLCICISLLLLVCYGYKYWSQEQSEYTTLQFNGYLALVGIEFIFSTIGWIGVYNHSRMIAAGFTYWVIAHIPIMVVIFWISSLYEYLVFYLYIIWIVFQLVLLVLLWKFKQILKLVYGWNDVEKGLKKIESEDIEKEQKIESDPKIEDIGPPSEQIEENKTNGVNVTINFTIPQQQQQQQMQQMQQQQMHQQQMQQMQYQMQPQGMYQPMPPMMGHQQQMIPQQMMGQQIVQQPIPPPLVPMMSDPQSPHLQHMKTHAPLHELQNQPSYAPNVEMHRSLSSQQQQQRMHNLADIARQADPPQSIHDQQVDRSEMKVDSNPIYGNSKGNVVTTDYGDDELYGKPAQQENGRRQTKGGGAQYMNSQSGDSGPGMDAMQTEGGMGGMTGGEGMEEGMGTVTGNGNGFNGNGNGMTVQGIIPSNGNGNEPRMRASSNNSDDDVLGDDFVAEIAPDPKATPNGVNLYFLDPEDPHHEAMYNKGSGTKGGH